MKHIVNIEAALFKSGKWLLIKRGEGEEHESGEVTITQPEEVAEAVWMSLEEIQANGNIKEWTKMYIKKAAKVLNV